jgi:hypothetical protein
MEREVWAATMRRLDSIPVRRPARCEFTDSDIVRVLLWAALHDRPVSWACDPRAWPGRRRDRPLPSCATMSRRLRSLSVGKLLRRLLPRGARGGGVESPLCLDGKPLLVGVFSKDREAKRGHAGASFSRGYKLHVACDRRGVPRAFDIRPMPDSECVTARRLLSRAGAPGVVALADAAYDSNRLYAIAASKGARLIAPRRKAGRSISKTYTHHPDRLRAVDLLEGDDDKRRQAARLRSIIERYFGWLTAMGGGHLPPWVRGLRRVRLWIIAKMALLHASRHP